MKGMQGLDMGVKAFTNITSSITSVVDTGKKRQYEQAVSNLSFEQQKKLNEQLLKAKSQQDRIAILSNVALQVQESKKARQTKEIIILSVVVLGSALAILAAVYVLKKK